jgi:hypothetical protein
LPIRQLCLLRQVCRQKRTAPCFPAVIPQDGVGDEPDPTLPAASARASGDVTLILSHIEQGEPQAAEQLLPLV